MEAALNLAIWLPFAAAIAIVLLPVARESNARWVALGASGITLVLAALLALSFSRLPATGAPQFVTNLPWIAQLRVSYFVGLDGLSLPMFILNAFLVFLAVLVSWNTSLRPRGYFALLMVLETAVSGVFASLDFFLFFLFWELELAPMFLLIGIWGSTRREYAAMKFILYTVAGSAFMLVGILVLYFTAPVRSFDMVYLATQQYAPAVQSIVWLLLFIGFAVKIPIFPFHTWLPDAHTEAPTAISVLLAGVLLKMGAYGLLRANVGMLPDATRQFAMALAVLAVINVLYGALVAMMQSDLKRVIANSSISHMGYVVLGAAALTPMALEGAVFQMFAHGTITGLLFIMVGLVYDRTHTREISDLGGLAGRMPFIAVTFIVAALASLGLPGLAGFVAEFLVFVGSFPAWRWATIIAVFTIVVTAGYMLWLLERVFFGPERPQWTRLGDASRLEVATVGALLAVIVIVGVFPTLLASIIVPSVSAIATRYVV
jgi:NADH-quinone oxidoreductase subunit M